PCRWSPRCRSLPRTSPTPPRAHRSRVPRRPGREPPPTQPRQRRRGSATSPPSPVPVNTLRGHRSTVLRAPPPPSEAGRLSAFSWFLLVECGTRLGMERSWFGRKCVASLVEPEPGQVHEVLRLCAGDH